MSNLFKDMTTQGLEESQDRLGGFQVYDTDIYEGVIKNLFAGKSAGGANSMTLILGLPGDKEYRETIYFTDKAGKNYFINKNDDKKKSPLPGFTTVNDICLIATGKELNEQETEEKVVKVYDPEAKKELPKSVPVLVECVGQKIAVGIVKALENKNKKNDSTGEYEATAEERENNFIDKVFHPEMKVTVVEARQGKQTGEFWDAWLKRNKGQVRDRREYKGDGKDGGTPPKAAAKGQAPTAPKKSLFGK